MDIRAIRERARKADELTGGACEGWTHYYGTTEAAADIVALLARVEELEAVVMYAAAVRLDRNRKEWAQGLKDRIESLPGFEETPAALDASGGLK